MRRPPDRSIDRPDDRRPLGRAARAGAVLALCATMAAAPAAASDSARSSPSGAGPSKARVAHSKASPAEPAAAGAGTAGAGTAGAKTAVAGTAVAASGEVRVLRISRGWQWMQPLARADALHAGDTVITGDDGRVQLRLADGAVVSLQPRSRFRIDEYRFDAGGQRGFFSLLGGALRVVTGAIGRRSPEDYRLTTPTATIGVRGTDYEAEQIACELRCAPGTTAGLRVAVRQGRVVVASAAGVVEVPAGQTVFLPSAAAWPDADPAPAPVPWPAPEDAGGPPAEARADPAPRAARPGRVAPPAPTAAARGARASDLFGPDLPDAGPR